MGNTLPTKLEIVDPYVCEREQCENFCIALDNGVTEDDAVSLCQSAMRRIIGGNQELIEEAMLVGPTCGLYLADQNGEFGAPEPSAVA